MEDETTDNGSVNNDVSGSVGGHVIQGDHVVVNINNTHRPPAPSKPKVSEYMRSLYYAIENALDDLGDQPLVVVGPDAVAVVRFWARRAGEGHFRGKTSEIDMEQGSWRQAKRLPEHRTLVLLVNATSLADVRECIGRRIWAKGAMVVVATRHNLPETEDMRVLRTSRVRPRTAKSAVLPSKLRYTLHPARFAIPAAFADLVIVVNAARPLPGFVVVLLVMLTAGVAALIGQAFGRVRRRFRPPTGGQLSISPDGILLCLGSDIEEFPWQIIEFVAVVPRDGVHALLLKTRGLDRLGLGVEGIIGLCLVGFIGPYSDQPAVGADRRALVNALRLYWTGPVIDTRAALMARDKRLGDRVWPGPRSA
ncbi:hypothetical protein [Kutzneria sp. NPDC051319]|uniref:hypothetical protein n=1 Tax=Kutzneria sp. NPDC051319 TaxID=3155047 RepID=UPI0034400EDC